MILLAALGFCLPTAAQYVTDPTPSIAVTGTVTTLRKELSGWGGYGPSGADILYTSQIGTWNFNLTSLGLNPAGFSQVTLAPRLALDDHGISISLYSLEILLNGAVVFSGPASSLGLSHGTPAGGPFNNWIIFESGPLAIADPLVVTIRNTSAAGGGDWLAIDAISLNLQAVPEPSMLALIGLGTVPVIILRRFQPARR